MKKISDFIVDKRNYILVIFIILSGLSLYISNKVVVNSDISKYLPNTSETRIGMDIMEKNFDEITSSSLKVMFEGLSEEEKEVIYKELEDIDGIDSVSWDNSDTYNKDDYTLFIINVSDDSDSNIANSIYEEVSSKYEDAYLDGSIASANTEVLGIGVLVIAVVAAMIILIIMCESYFEPFLFLFTIGLGVLLNNGTNIIFSSVSNITAGISAILQMALSMDYSIMLMNRYTQERESEKNRIKAMKKALHHSFSSISSSSLTTIVGLLALVFMSFTIGRDLGFVLAKGVLFSLICVFTCLPGLIILFDDLIKKTIKKNINIRLDYLGKLSYKLRYVMLFVFIVLFILSFIFKGNLKIVYTGSEHDEIGKIFKENNVMALIYNNEYEEEISNICKDLEDKDNIDSVLCYSNTINDDLTYNELNDKLLSLGFNDTIDDELLKIIYYTYYNKDEVRKYSLNDLINLLDKDIRNNKNFKDVIEDDIYTNISLLKNFTTKDNVNKKRTAKELNKILGIKSKDLDSLLIYYNSKNIDLKLSLTTFLNFMNNDIMNDSTYASMIPSSSKDMLKQLTPFSSKSNINTRLTSSELSKMFGIDEEAIKGIMLLYYLDKESNTLLSLNEFIIATDNIAKNTNFLDNVDTSFIANYVGIAKNENNINNTLMPKAMLNNMFSAISPSLVDTVYYASNLADDYMFTPIDFIDFVISNFSANLQTEEILSLKLLSSIMNNDDKKYSASELSKLLNQDKKGIINIYNLIDYTSGKTYTLSPLEFVNVILANKENPSISSAIDRNAQDNLELLRTVMTSINKNTKYNASSLAKVFGLNKSDMEFLYSLYEYKKDNNIKVSLKEFIQFMVSDIINNKTYSNLIDNDTKDKLVSINVIIKNTLNNKLYTPNDAYDTLKNLSNDLDKEMIELLFLYGYSLNNYNDSWTLTIEELINFINSDILNDKTFKLYIDEDINNTINDAKKEIDDAKNMLVTKNYSRMVINTTYASEGKETFKFIEELKKKLDSKDKDMYLIGDSLVAYDINNSFDNELNLITILTMLFIFIVVAITFKSLITPLILVLIIQCAVFITMGILSILGGSVYFIAILVVQSILMGATIDYAIVYTSYYKENRVNNDVTTSLINAYNSSIHTILSSGAVLAIVTLIVGNFALAESANICRTISQGAICSMLLILLVLPALLAVFDKYISKSKKG